MASVKSLKVLLRNPERWNGVEGECIAAASVQALAPVLAALLKHSKSVNALLQSLNGLSGFFAAIGWASDGYVVAVDRVRSIPLYYREYEDSVVVSDDGAVLAALEGSSPDALSIQEFLLSGYVTGDRTLRREVKQLQAGEALVSSAGHLEVVRYYEYVHLSASEALADDDYIVALDSAAQIAFERLAEVASGKMIVLPLSGGLDSRVIGAMLRRTGYDKVVAFTYGSHRSAEVPLARNVARRLGLRWHYIPYTLDTWRELRKRPEWEMYLASAGGLAALPHIQDLPAVMYLREQNLVDQSAIFVPGHTGDFISGGHLPDEVFDGDSITKAAFVNTVFRKHYALWPEVPAVIRQRLYERIAEVSGCRDDMGAAEAASLYERWEWQERQAKFIVNSVRVYDHLGYDWWLPLWDGTFMDFWSKVPFALKRRQRLYRDWAGNLYSQIAGVTRREAMGTERSLNPMKSGLADRLRATPLRPLVRRVHRMLLKASAYDTHPMQWYGLLPRARFDELYTGRQSVNSFMTLEYLKLRSPHAAFRKR